MTYCTNCVMPNTKPDLHFDEKGVCDACRSAELKDKIDWTAREKEFRTLIEQYRSKDGSQYDCIIPVSGGKDSTYQAYVIKELYGLNPLCVTFAPTYPTELGRINLQNLYTTFGVDHILFNKNPKVYKAMCLEGFRRVGDHEWPNHLGIFTVPIRVAVNYRIPLLVWGENSQLEYGGPATARQKPVLDRRWLEEFGGLLGNRTEDMIGVEGITRADLKPYYYPTDEELASVGVTGIFLGYFFKWDARTQVDIVKSRGFSVKEDGPIEGTFTNYENLDDGLVSIHDYFKYTKFGFGRATDHACLDIRNKRMTRNEGVEIVKKYDGKLFMEVVEKFCEFFAITQKEFFSVVDRFTNKAIFECDDDGTPIRDAENNLIKKPDCVITPLS
ncbi:MAG: N-acetyl sugar amidotransferase [bacterium]